MSSVNDYLKKLNSKTSSTTKEGETETRIRSFQISVKKANKSSSEPTVLRRQFTESMHIKDIKQAYIDQEGVGTLENIVLQKGGKILQDNSTLEDCGIKYRKRRKVMLITIIFKVKGGSMKFWVSKKKKKKAAKKAAKMEEKEEKKMDDKSSKKTKSKTKTKTKAKVKVMRKGKKKRVFDSEDKEIVLTKKADCIFGYTNKDGIPRAKMPCGHAFAAQTMFDYVVSILNRNNVDYEIFCPVPKCKKRTFDWELVCSVACMDEKEYERYTKVVEDRSTPDTVTCPTCENPCCRPTQLLMYRVNCNACRGSDFCWYCGKAWKSSGSMSLCGNSGCETEEINKSLKNCGTKDLGGSYGNVKVPEFRACPKCFTFIMHKEACKHMTCPDCKHKFCFSCLAAKNANGTWPCNSYADQCPIAARQQLK